MVRAPIGRVFIVYLRLTTVLWCECPVGGVLPPAGHFLFASCARAIPLVAVAVMRVVRAALSFEVTLCPAPRALSRANVAARLSRFAV